MKRYIQLLLTLCLIVSCAPINYFTKVQKTPREYSVNYSIDGLKAPVSDLNKREWIVYSDRDKNATYSQPGGKIKMKELNFLDPLLVIGSNGDFLRVIKYSPEIVKSGKLKDRKKAEYYGWIDRSRLLLTSQGVTDVRSGLKMKFLTTITDTLSICKPKLFFKGDQLRLFKDPNLTIEAEPAPLYEVVYILKKSDDGTRVLLSRKPIVEVDQALGTIMGWVSTRMVQTIAEQLFVDLTTVPEFMSGDLFGIKIPESTKYSPVFCFTRSDSTDFFNTAVQSPVIDKRDNFVYNVAGKRVDFKQSKTLEAAMRRINVVFVFEMGEKMLTQFPNLVNVVQSSGALFAANDSLFTYRFGAVTAGQIGNRPLYDIVPLTSDYSVVVDRLTHQSDNIKKMGETTQTQLWQGVSRAIELFKADPEASNIIILIGEKGGNSESADRSMVEQMATNNCRLLSFQLYAGSGAEYNNFVLQSTNIVEGYANLTLETKQERLFSADQLRGHNAFKESSKNSYSLDFPARSITQGSVIFPEKEQTLTLDILQGAIKEFSDQVKSDNKDLINSLHKSLDGVGNQKDKYDSLFVSRFAIDPKSKLSNEFKEAFSENSPLWYNKISGATATVDSVARYHLLLSESELEELKVFVDKLIALEVDVKGASKKGAGSSSSKKSLCADDQAPYLPDINTITKLAPNDSLPIKYASTGKIRRSLKKLLLSEMTECKLCKRKSRALKRYTLADALLMITSAPTNDHLLNTITVRDLSNKKVLSDQMLDHLIEYFKKKRADLDAGITSKVKFTSAGQDYYWIDAGLLP